MEYINIKKFVYLESTIIREVPLNKIWLIKLFSVTLRKSWNRKKKTKSNQILSFGDWFYCRLRVYIQKVGRCSKGKMYFLMTSGSSFKYLTNTDEYLPSTWF